jgi:hypothetical protein
VHLILWLIAALSTSFIAVFLYGDASDLSDTVQSCDPSNDASCPGSYYNYSDGFGTNSLSYADLRSYIGMEAALVAFFAILT